MRGYPPGAIVGTAAGETLTGGGSDNFIYGLGGDDIQLQGKVILALALPGEVWHKTAMEEIEDLTYEPPSVREQNIRMGYLAAGFLSGAFIMGAAHFSDKAMEKIEAPQSCGAEPEITAE